MVKLYLASLNQNQRIYGVKLSKCLVLSNRTNGFWSVLTKNDHPSRYVVSFSHSHVTARGSSLFVRTVVQSLTALVTHMPLASMKIQTFEGERHQGCKTRHLPTPLCQPGAHTVREQLVFKV